VTAAGRDKRWLDEHLPHGGRMNLLASVLRWDEGSIHCEASSHRAPDNPLRRGAVLPVAAAIEYAAQAVAAHGALLSGGIRSPAPGFLASVRSVTFGMRRIDDIACALDVDANRIGGDAGGVLYGFRVAAGGREVASGRLAVILEASRPPAGEGAGL
jgi:predicted hotdog family 3-hydroxylacyl-ACP dehydratase